MSVFFGGAKGITGHAIKIVLRRIVSILSLPHAALSVPVHACGAGVSCAPEIKFASRAGAHGRARAPVCAHTTVCVVWAVCVCARERAHTHATLVSVCARARA